MRQSPRLTAGEHDRPSHGEGPRQGTPLSFISLASAAEAATLAGLFAAPGPEEPREGEGSVPDSCHGRGSGRAKHSPAAGVPYIMGSQCSCPTPRRELANKFINRSC